MNVVADDKENKKEFVNRLSNPISNNTSSTSLLKRSKTSDPVKAPLRQK